MDAGESSGSQKLKASLGVGWWKHQHRHKIDVYKEVLRRLRESRCSEVESPTFDKELRAHFNRLTPNYALNFNMASAEDVLMHMRLLKLARNPATRPAFLVRVVEVSIVPVFYENKSNSSHPDKKGKEEATSRRSAHPPPAFGSSSNLELHACEANVQTQDGDSVGSSILCPSKDGDNVESSIPCLTKDGSSVGSSGPPSSRLMYEINYSSGDRLLLLGQVLSLLSNLGLHISEAHAFNTNDGYLLDVFVVDGFSCEEIEQLKVALQEGFQKIEAGSEPQPLSAVREIEELKETTQSDCVKVRVDEMDVFEIDSSLLKLGNKVASGSFGDVYHGKYHSQEVAIKLLKPGPGKVDAVAEFRQEVYMMRKIRHKNVVQFIGACTLVPDLYIITEFMTCGSVYDVLKDKGHGFSLPTLLKVAIDVSNGMEYLHHCDIIHRDLKPGNLLMDENGVVKISDFGVSRVKDPCGVMTKEIGSYRWMAPEMLRRHKRYDHKVDVFSFGIVLWQLLTGEVPYGALSSLEAAQWVLKSKLRPEIPEGTRPELAELMKRCWEHEPAQRPDFSEILERLQDIEKEVQVQVQGESASPLKKLLGGFCVPFRRSL